MIAVAPFFTEMENYIATSRATVAAGEELSLIGLDENIGKLCDLIMELSQEEKMLYEDRLRELLESLNALGNEMRVAEGDLKDISTHRNASVAYKTADSRDNFGKRDGDK